MRLTLPEWLPDMPALDNPGAIKATNLYPRTVRSYGPLNDLQVGTDALDARCQGAVAGKDKDGNVSHFAGDATDLYKLTAGAWGKVSKSVGAYATATDNMWRGIVTGLDGTQRLLMTNFSDAVQAWALGSSSSFSDLAAAAPRARQIAEIGEFVMLGNTFDSVDGAVPNRVRWSAISDPTDWPVIGSSDAAAKQSDFQDLEGEWVNGLIGAVGGASGAVFSDSAVHRIDFEGAPTVFRFPTVEKARGTPAPDSIINVGPFAFYLGEDGFYAFDGSQSVPIGNQKVDKTFYTNLDQTYFHRVVAAVDPINKLVFWAYPTSSATGGNPDRLLIYNWEIGRWAEGEIETEFIYRALSEGYTLEQLDSINTSIDALPFSLDSRVWTGGRIVLAGFDTTHKQGYFEGSTLAATVDTAEFAGQNGKRLFINGLRPLVDGGTVTAGLLYRDTPQAALTVSTATAAGVDGVCPQRVDTRYARARINIAAGGSWEHAQGLEPSMIETGSR